MNTPVVTVRGEATREVEPDLATISASVHAGGPSAEAVSAELAEGSQRLAAVIERFAAAIERSNTSGLWVHPVTDRRNTTKISGYRGSFTSEVVVHDFGKLSELVLALGGVPNAQLAGPWWSLRDDNPVHRAVRLDAIGDGRRRADDYAAAFGARVAELLEISDLEPAYGGPVPRAMAFAGAAKSAPEVSFDFEPQPQTVSGQVTLRFTITQAILDG